MIVTSAFLCDMAIRRDGKFNVMGLGINKFQPDHMPYDFPNVCALLSVQVEEDDEGEVIFTGHHIDEKAEKTPLSLAIRLTVPKSHEDWVDTYPLAINLGPLQIKNPGVHFILVDMELGGIVSEAARIPFKAVIKPKIHLVGS